MQLMCTKGNTRLGTTGGGDQLGITQQIKIWP